MYAGPMVDPLPVLGKEIMERVFFFAEPEDCCRLGRVCKAWRELLVDDGFWHKYAVFVVDRSARFSALLREYDAEGIVKGVRTAIRGQFQGLGVRVDPIPFKAVFLTLCGPYPALEENSPISFEDLWNEPSLDYITAIETGNASKLASVEKLVSALTSPEVEQEKIEAMSEFVFGVFREVISPIELFSRLRLRFAKPVLKGLLGGRIGYIKHVGEVRERTVLALTHWMELFFEDDFMSDQTMFRSLDCFIKHSFLEHECLDNRVHMAQYLSAGDLGFTSALLSPNTTKDELRLYAFHMTLQEQAMFQACKRSEFLQMGWTRKDKASKAPNVLKFVQWFNKVSNRVTNDILLHRDLFDRADTMTMYLRLAILMYEMRNYNGCIEIITGLTCSEVYRLQATWERVPSKVFTKFEEIMDALSTQKNFSSVRATLKPLFTDKSVAVVPYLGMWLTDLAFIAEGNPEAKYPAINVKRMRLQFNVIAQLISLQNRPRYQARGYEWMKDLAESGTIHKTLQNAMNPAALQWPGERGRIQRSRALEPRDFVPPKKKRKKKEKKGKKKKKKGKDDDGPAFDPRKATILRKQSSKGALTAGMMAASGPEADDELNIGAQSVSVVAPFSERVWSYADL